MQPDVCVLFVGSLLLICKHTIGGYRCPVPNDCSNVICNNRTIAHCPLGNGWPVCGCCEQCFKDLSANCGLMAGHMLCGAGMLCKGERYKNGRHVPGICVADGTLRKCPGKPTCNKICKPPTYCEYGIALPYCGCCPVCLRGLGKVCDGYNPCGNAYYCHHYTTYYGFALFPGYCALRKDAKKNLVKKGTKLKPN